MMKQTRLFSVLTVIAVSSAVAGPDISWTPKKPKAEDVVMITVSDCSQSGILHWGVNALGSSWKQAIPAYRPDGHEMWGVATRVVLGEHDGGGGCSVRLGPFDNTNQAVGSIDFVVQWDDGSWENSGGKDFHIPVTQGRIEVMPSAPHLNDTIEVLVHRSQPGGLLRWGVNADRGKWSPPDLDLWPGGTTPSDDGLAVDSPLSAPNAEGVSRITLGPFNSGEQVVTSLHMAVHWDDDWDTDLSRNYNVRVSPRSKQSVLLGFVTPVAGQVVTNQQDMVVKFDARTSVSVWLDGESVKTRGISHEVTFDISKLEYGEHMLTAQAGAGDTLAVASRRFWYIPQVVEEPLVGDFRDGATIDPDNVVTFVLYAPGKRYISVVGDFNEWDSLKGVMKKAPDGRWWFRTKLEPGEYQYQYVIDGDLKIGDPYSRDVDWTDEKGVETYKPKYARSVIHVGAKPFEWTDQDYQRPPLEKLAIYELYIPDMVLAGGFTGMVARLDYIKSMGFNAIEPLPVQEFTGIESWGYNPSFHMAPETWYGTPDELKTLINEAHRRGIAVIVDTVLNHMDWQSPLFQIYGDDYDSSPYFYLFEGENWGFPDLNQKSEAFKRYVAEYARVWLEEYRVDGFRYDATRWVGWKGYNDWGASWFAYAGRQVDSNSYHIAEHLPTDPDLMNQTEMDTSWHAHFRWRIRDMLRNKELMAGEFERIMDPLQLGFSNAVQRIAYVESHDEERVVRELVDAGFSLAEALDRAEMGLALTLTAPGIPMVYAGQEFGESTRKVVGWNALQWMKLELPIFRRLYESTKRLTTLRTYSPALSEGSFRILQSDPEHGVAVYERKAGEAIVIVAVNFGDEDVELAMKLPGGGLWNIVIGDENIVIDDDLMVNLPLHSGRAVVLEHGAYDKAD
ncbi:MAG: hypothetical protein KJ626_14745 [Verrucomicrobia bacterium]|nr:hypothetical protein [Verrucomicrobiota bacterium]